MSAAVPSTAQTGAQLLRALERTGPHPALAWYGESGRIELSGHVLANWVIKSIGHLHDEIALEPGDLVVLDLPPHWKRLTLALAAWMLGADVRVLERESGAATAVSDGSDIDGSDIPGGVAEPRVVATDRPASQLAESADEVLALEAVSLAPRFSGQLPPLVHDWLAEVRGSSDRLGVALPAWSGPDARDDSAAPRGTVDPHGSSEPRSGAASAPRLLVDEDGLPVIAQVLGAMLAGGGIVGPTSVVTERQAQEEGVTARA